MSDAANGTAPHTPSPVEQLLNENVMTIKSITCPKCGFSREVPGERIPDRPVQVTCPRCKATFPFSREPEAAPLPTATAPQPVQPAVRKATSPLPAHSPPANKSRDGSRPSARGESQQKAAQPAPKTRAKRPILKTVRLLILITILLGTIVYALREKIPLQKIRAAAVPTRQIIVIPPPAGPMPALTPGSVSVKVTAGDASPTGAAATPPATDSRFEAYNFPVFIYAVNLIGKVRVNGQEFKEIKGDPDKQYNINTYGEPFRYGANSIELDLTPVTGGNRSMNPELRMKISRRSGGDERRVIGEWQFAGQSGWPRTISLEIPEVGQ